MSKSLTVRPSWNRAEGLAALARRWQHIGLLLQEQERLFCHIFLKYIASQYENKPEHFWFHYCWPNTGCNASLFSAGITELSLPPDVHVTPVEFGVSLLTQKVGAPTEQCLDRMLHCILEQITRRDSIKGTRIIVPLYVKNHWGILIIEFEHSDRDIPNLSGYVHFGDSLSFPTFTSIHGDNAKDIMCHVLKLHCTLGTWNTSTTNFITNRIHLGFADQEDSHSSAFYVINAISTMAKSKGSLPPEGYHTYTATLTENIRTVCCVKAFAISQHVLKKCEISGLPFETQFREHLHEVWPTRFRHLREDSTSVVVPGNSLQEVTGRDGYSVDLTGSADMDGLAEKCMSATKMSMDNMVRDEQASVLLHPPEKPLGPIRSYLLSSKRAMRNQDPMEQNRPPRKRPRGQLSEMDTLNSMSPYHRRSSPPLNPPEAHMDENRASQERPRGQLSENDALESAPRCDEISVPPLKTPKARMEQNNAPQMQRRSQRVESDTLKSVSPSDRSSAPPRDAQVGCEVLDIVSSNSSLENSIKTHASYMDVEDIVGYLVELVEKGELYGVKDSREFLKKMGDYSVTVRLRCVRHKKPLHCQARMTARKYRQENVLWSVSLLDDHNHEPADISEVNMDNRRRGFAENFSNWLPKPERCDIVTNIPVVSATHVPTSTVYNKLLPQPTLILPRSGAFVYQNLSAPFPNHYVRGFRGGMMYPHSTLGQGIYPFGMPLPPLSATPESCKVARIGLKDGAANNSNNAPTNDNNIGDTTAASEMQHDRCNGVAMKSTDVEDVVGYFTQLAGKGELYVAEEGRVVAMGTEKYAMTVRLECFRYKRPMYCKATAIARKYRGNALLWNVSWWDVHNHAAAVVSGNIIENRRRAILNAFSKWVVGAYTMVSTSTRTVSKEGLQAGPRLEKVQDETKEQDGNSGCGNTGQGFAKAESSEMKETGSHKSSFLRNDEEAALYEVDVEDIVGHMVRLLEKGEAYGVKDRRTYLKQSGYYSVKIRLRCLRYKKPVQCKATVTVRKYRYENFLWSVTSSDVHNHQLEEVSEDVVESRRRAITGTFSLWLPNARNFQKGPAATKPSPTPSPTPSPAPSVAVKCDNGGRGDGGAWGDRRGSRAVFILPRGAM